MAWRNGFYYRSKRKGNKVVTEYLGNNLVADLASQHDEQQRLARQAEREALQALAAAEQAVDTEIDAIGKLLSSLVDAHLLLAGYRQHNRGEWRKKRDKRQ